MEHRLCSHDGGLSTTDFKWSINLFDNLAISTNEMAWRWNESAARWELYSLSDNTLRAIQVDKEWTAV